MPVDVRLDGIRACVFDAYGTLFDTAAAAARCKDALGDKFAALATLRRDKQLQYTWLRAVQGRQRVLATFRNQQHIAPIFRRDVF